MGLISTKEITETSASRLSCRFLNHQLQIGKKEKKKHFLLGLVTLSSTALQNFKLNLIEKEIDNGYQLFSMLYNYVSIAMKEKMKKGTTVVTTRLIVCASLSVYSLQQFEFAYDSLISPFGTIGYHFNLFFFISKSLKIKKKKIPLISVIPLLLLAYFF